ncbi:MAG: hypothetical protein NZM25_01230 [Leptospiraceae bacterium]|nr:hypothetical protein [Leptospiraceae bacterium]MDW8306347.1 hypothetical protein [Leptospiraceae bacterium]
MKNIFVSLVFLLGVTLAFANQPATSPTGAATATEKPAAEKEKKAKKEKADKPKKEAKEAKKEGTSQAK